MFYEQLLHPYSCAKILQSQTVTREKLHKTLSNDKVARKVLMKLTPEHRKPLMVFSYISNLNLYVM